MTETLAYGYSSESALQELSNEYQHDRFWLVFKKSSHSCALDKSIASALEGLKHFQCSGYFCPNTNYLNTLQPMSYWYSLEATCCVLSDEYRYARVSAIYHFIFASNCFDQISHGSSRRVL